MKKRIILIHFFSLFSFPLFGTTDFSLLFKRTEIDMIRERLHGGGDLNLSAPDVAINALYLSSILFMDTHNWALWLNDQVVRTGELLDAVPFRIENVTPSTVTFSLTSSQTPKRTFHLNPGQTYLLEEGTIVRGDLREKRE